MKISLTLATLLLFLAVSPVFAIQKSSTDTAEAGKILDEQKRQLVAEKKEKIVAAKCANMESKIEAQTTRYNDGKVRRLNAYNNMKTRLTSLEAKLTARGYDTTKLKADLPILSTKIDKFSTDYAVYIAALSETKSFACGKTEGEFRAQLLETKDLLASVHADSKAIKDYYATTIKPDLQEIKKQTPTLNRNGNTNATNGNTNTATGN